jgi:thymidylate synthase ThyX
MTMPDERYGALTRARELLHELRSSEAATPQVRHRALVILRHYARVSELDDAARTMPHWLEEPAEKLRSAERSVRSA